MKTQFKAVCLFIAFLFCTLGLSAQYGTSVGLRLGSPTSLSLKHFISESNALEAYVGFRSYSWGSNWVGINGAYLRHQELDEITEGLTWYVGGGLGVYFWNYDDFFFDNYSTTTIGLQGYAGVEYTFDSVPLAISIDWIPTFFVGTTYLSSFGARYGSLGVRYIFNE